MNRAGPTNPWTLTALSLRRTFESFILREHQAPTILAGKLSDSEIYRAGFVPRVCIMKNRRLE